MKEDSLREKLNELYTNVKSTPSYGAKIKEFLQSYNLHSVNKRISKKKFPRRRVIARFPFDVWMCDLAEYQQFRFHNSGFRFILVVIDCFTKMVYVEPLKRKTKEETASAIEKIISRAEPPVMLVTDGGKEFFNQDFSNVMQSYNINHFKTPTLTKFKASLAERVIRTIKTKIHRYFQKTKSKRWIDVVQQIVDNYNNTPHSSHGSKPIDVNNENRREIYKKLYPLAKVNIECKLNEGDRVRTLRTKTEFEKGYTPNWSSEIFIIVKRLKSNAVCWYKLSTINGDSVPGIWYYHQLNLVTRYDNQHLS